MKRDRRSLRIEGIYDHYMAFNTLALEISEFRIRREQPLEVS